MITLATDFGSPYPAAVRGVLLDHSPEVDRLVDLTHALPRGRIRESGFWLTQLLPWFPPATHLAVVDPGVGTDRAALVFRVDDHLIVAPDNGLALPAARAIALDDHRVPLRHPSPTIACGADPDAAIEVFEFRYSSPASDTFHGRDVFAPAAAAVHDVGPANIEDLSAIAPAASFVDLRIDEPDQLEDGHRAEIISVDDFGNAITTLPGEVITDHDTVRVDGVPIPVRSAYASVAPGDPVVAVGSHGNAELSVNDGRGDVVFDVSVGDPVEITP